MQRAKLFVRLSFILEEKINDCMIFMFKDNEQVEQLNKAIKQD